MAPVDCVNVSGDKQAASDSDLQRSVLLTLPMLNPVVPGNEVGVLLVAAEVLDWAVAKAMKTDAKVMATRENMVTVRWVLGWSGSCKLSGVGVADA